MQNTDFVRVNIHNEGKVPWLNIQGPRYGINISSTIYRILKEDPRVMVYPADNDPVMAARLQEQTKKVEEVVVTDAVEVVVKVQEEVQVEEIVEVSNEEDIIEIEADVVIEELEDETIEEVIEEEIVEEFEYQEQPIMQILEPDEEDRAIDEALEGYSDEEEDLIISEEEILEEVAEISGVVVYTEDELLLMTKEQLKVILNENRGFEPGTEFYGRYHDNHDVLVAKVLNSQ
jgi:hypothetical protein